MSPEAPVASCPRCGSTVRRGSDWCTLCFADLRPVPPPRVSPDPPMASPPASAGPGAKALPGTSESSTRVLTAVSPQGHGASVACRTCGEAVPLELAVCGACGAGLFDTLREEATSFTLPLIGDVMKLGKGARAGLAFAFAGVVVVLLFLVLTVAGHFL